MATGGRAVMDSVCVYEHAVCRWWGYGCGVVADVCNTVLVERVGQKVTACCDSLVAS